MKKLMIICICFFSYTISTKAAELKLIQEATVETDYVLEGVHGILISYNFVESKNEVYIDSINDLLFHKRLNIGVHLFENNKAIKPIEDYEKHATIDGSIVFFSEIRRFYPRDLPEPTFIPYATLNLSEGKHTISAKFEVYNYEQFGSKYKKQYQTFELKNFSFVKPKTQKMSIHFDAIELKPIKKIVTNNEYDDADDADKPNAELLVNLSEIYVFSADFKDKFSTTSKEDCITFTISKNDIISVKINKHYDMYDPILPVVYFNTEELIPNKWTEYNKKNERLLKCKIFYKVE